MLEITAVWEFLERLKKNAKEIFEIEIFSENLIKNTPRRAKEQSRSTNCIESKNLDSIKNTIKIKSKAESPASIGVFPLLDFLQIKNIRNFETIFENIYFENFKAENVELLRPLICECCGFLEANFKNAKFNDFVSFKNCDFNGLACFGGVQFLGVFSFCGSEFARKPDFVGSEHRLSFGLLKDFVFSQSSPITAARELQSSFCSIKNLELEQDNKISANIWSKFELYCEEIALYFTPQNMARWDKFSSYKERILLSVYRINSAHHTDFWRILNFSAGMICCYCVLIFAFHKISLFVVKNSDLLWVLDFLEIFAILGYFLLLFGYFWAFVARNLFLEFLSKTAPYFILFFVLIFAPSFVNPFFGNLHNADLLHNRAELELSKMNPDSLHNLLKIIEQNGINSQNIAQDQHLLGFGNNLFDFVKNNRDVILQKFSQIKTDSMAHSADISEFSEFIAALFYDKIMSEIIGSSSVLYGLILLLCGYCLAKSARRYSE